MYKNVVTKDQVVIYHEGDSYMVNNSHPKFNEIKNLVIEKASFESVLENIQYSTSRIIADYFQEKGYPITISKRYLTLSNGVVVENKLTDRIIHLIESHEDPTMLINFLQRVQDNPTVTAIGELFDFLEKSNLPITEDGHFLAYKVVKSDFMDIYTGTLDYSVGNVVQMPRENVCSDRQKTCSVGLHFCSKEYLPHYYGYDSNYKVVILKIDPADVVSIPDDYNFAKGRCCKVEVIGEVDVINDEFLKSNWVREERFTNRSTLVNWEDVSNEKDFFTMLFNKFDISKYTICKWNNQGERKGILLETILQNDSFKENIDENNIPLFCQDDIPWVVSVKRDVASIDRFVVIEYLKDGDMVPTLRLTAIPYYSIEEKENIFPSDFDYSDQEDWHEDDEEDYWYEEDEEEEDEDNFNY